MMARLNALGQTSEAISRELSVFNSGVPTATISPEAISRELSIFNSGVPTATINPEAISREVSVFNNNVSGLITPTEAVSREVSIFNPGAFLIVTSAEAVSREISVFNSTAPFVATNLEAISREVSVYNYGVPPVQFSVGSTNAVKNLPAEVPFQYQTALDLTNLTIALQTDDSRLQILGVTPVAPEVLAATLGTVMASNHPITFTLNPAAIAGTNHLLAYLNFQGTTNLDSAVVPLRISNFSANRTSGQPVPGVTTDGSVILIVNEPILFQTNQLPLQFSLYGLPGATYSIEASTNLRSWLPIYTTPPLTNVVQFLDPASMSFPKRFYRAVQE